MLVVMTGRLLDILVIFLIVLLTAAAVLAALLVWALRRRGGPQKGERTAVLEERLANHQKERTKLEAEVADLRRNLELKSQAVSNLERELAVAIQELESEREGYQEKIHLLRGAREELVNQFKVLAAGILDEKSRTFKEENKSSMAAILGPLKERLGEFQRRIERNYETEGKERHSLRSEVQKLMEMNHRLSAEASNLTNALKGNSKTQGIWGEMVLERILEVSGLRRGEEYSLQESHTREDGSRGQPDVVIHLPGDRHMVIDSKVSLNAYNAYVNTESPRERSEALRSHIASVRTHLKALSSKEYHRLHRDKSPDFAVMFIPLEPAFMLAAAEDERLWEDGWRLNVLMVSPSTLLFVMRIVMQLWRQEQRGRNAMEIARLGAALHDKLAGFVEDFEAVGSRISQAGRSFEAARGKLATGRGNAIRQAMRLRELGVTPSKELPESYREAAQDDDNDNE